MPGVRCFVGVPLECAGQSAIATCRDEIISADSRWRDEKWVSSENLHLTLLFIGDVPTDELPALRERLGSAVVDHKAFSLPFARVVASPNARRARTLWAEYLDPAGSCARLADECANAATPYLTHQVDRAFRAHVTLCRARRAHGVNPAALSTATVVLTRGAASMSVPSATLLASRLTPRGSVYTEIEMWRLRGEESHR